MPTLLTIKKPVSKKHHSTVKDYFRNILNNAYDAIFVHDLDMKVIDVNDKMLEMYGVSLEEAINLTIIDDFSAPNNPIKRLPSIWKKVLAGKDQFFEWKAKRPKDGSTFDTEVFLRKLSLPDGDVVVANVRDITGRKQAEKQLDATRRYLRTVFNNVYDAIFVHDLHGKVIDVNDKLLDMYRISREEALDLFIINDYSAPENPIKRLPSIWKKVLAGKDQFFEWKAKRPKDGSTFDVEVFLTRLSLPDGDVILANVRDVTERKQVEQQLRATRKYLRTVFNNVYDAIFIHDSEGKVIDVNDKMLEMYGVTRDEALNRFIIDDYSAPDNIVPELYERWKKAMSDEHQFFEWKAKRPNDGTIFDVEVFLTKLSLPNGDFILANVRDITERKRMEKLLLKEREVFFSVMKNNPHGIALFHDQRDFLYFNPEFTNITGYTLEDIPTARDWAAKAYPDPSYRAEVSRFWKGDRLPEGRGRDVEWKVACKDGQYKDVEFRVTYLDDKSLVVLTDTTARKRAEEELRAEKLKFQALCESSPVGMVMMREDDDLLYINPKFRELFGYDLQDIPNIKDWFERAYPDPFYRNEVRSKWVREVKCLKPGEGSPYTRKVHCRDGTDKYINFIPVRLEDGEIFMTCEDITESMRAGDRVRQRNLELEVLNDIVSSVISSLHLPDILNRLAKVFTEKLGIRVGGIFLYDESGGNLTMEMCWGMTEAAQRDFEGFVRKLYHTEIAARENGVTFVKKHMKPPRSNDFLVNKFFYKWLSSLYIPLPAKGEIQGLICLFDEEHNLRQNQIGFFRTLGQQIGVAIQNARLFEQVRQSHTEMRALSLRLVEVQEAERRYIARELHDEIGQELTGLKLVLEMNTLQSDGKTKSNLMEAKSIVDNLMPLVRELSLNLRPTMLDDLGLLPTLPWHFERFSNQTNVHVSFKHTGLGSKRFALHLETAIFRIVQEALTNVARHAGVNEAVVRLWSDEKTLGVQIEDRGCSFDAVEALKTGNTGGLYGMRERAMLLGGHFTIEARPGHGTRLTAELPLDADSYKIIDHENY
jgi:PAS domain S-box-containing protein